MNTVHFTDEERRVLLYAVGQDICAQIHVVVTQDAILPGEKTMAIFKAVGGLFELRTLLLYAVDGMVTLSDAGLSHLEQVYLDVNERQLPPDVLLDSKRLQPTLLHKLGGSTQNSPIKDDVQLAQLFGQTESRRIS